MGIKYSLSRVDRQPQEIVATRECWSNTMIERLKAAYVDNTRVKLAAFAGLLLFAGIFVVLSGGFPPWAWRFLFSSVVPNLPHLLTQQGGGVFLPLLGLILLSLSLLIVWVVIVTLMIKIGTRLWLDYRSSQHFNMDLQEAEQLAERDLASDELDRWFEGEKRNAPMPMQRGPLSVPESGSTSALHSSATEAMQTSMPQRREYATAGRAARVSGGGLIFPETPTPPASPNFMAPVAPVAPFAPFASTAPAPTSLLRERSAPWLQPETGRYGEQNSGEGNKENEDWLNDQRPSYNPTSPISSAGSTNATNSSSFPPFSPLANPARKPLRVVPPPHVEETADSDSEQSIDKAFSALLERERAGQSTQSGSSRYPTRPEWADVEDVPDTSDFAMEAMDTINTRPEPPDPSILLAPAVNSDADFDPSTAGDAHLNIYDTIPFDESKLPQHGDESDEMPRLVVGIGLDPGIKRRDAPNEDSIFAIQGMRITDSGPLPAGLFVVADGMGGHANGREASRTAIHTVSDVIVPALLRDVSGRDAAEEETIFQDMLKDGVHRANLAIYRRNRESPEMMGTTLTAALIANSTAYIGNVGDSRTYLYRPSTGLHKVTRDHSEVARLVEAGAIAPEEIYTHPKRNRIYRCLGERASVEMDAFVIHLQPGDVLLLCSDGLWEMVRDDALEKLVASSAHNPTQLSAILVQAALNHGGVDNISVVAVGFQQGKA